MFEAKHHTDFSMQNLKTFFLRKIYGETRHTSALKRITFDSHREIGSADFLTQYLCTNKKYYAHLTIAIAVDPCNFTQLAISYSSKFSQFRKRNCSLSVTAETSLTILEEVRLARPILRACTKRKSARGSRASRSERRPGRDVTHERTPLQFLAASSSFTPCLRAGQQFWTLSNSSIYMVSSDYLKTSGARNTVSNFVAFL